MKQEKKQPFNVHFVPAVGTEEPLTEGGRPEGLPEGMAYVEQVGDGMVLHDPAAAAVAYAIARRNCETMLNENSDRIPYFKERATIRELSPDQIVIVILNVDDENGNMMAESLMPGHDWQAYRDRGETPVARGLADRDYVTQCLLVFDHGAYEELRDSTELSVVVVDHGVAIVHEA